MGEQGDANHVKTTANFTFFLTAGRSAAVLQPAPQVQHGGRPLHQPQRDRPPAGHQVQSPGQRLLVVVSCCFFVWGLLMTTVFDLEI